MAPGPSNRIPSLAAISGALVAVIGALVALVVVVDDSSGVLIGLVIGVVLLLVALGVVIGLMTQAKRK